MKRSPISANVKARMLGLKRGDDVTIGGEWVWHYVEEVAWSVRVERGGEGERFVSNGDQLERA